MTTFFPHMYEYLKITSLLREGDKKQINDEIQKHRRKRLLDCVESQISTKKHLTFNQCWQSKDLDFLMYLEIKALKLRESTYNPLKFYNVPIKTILKTRTELSNINKYEKPLNWPLPFKTLMQEKSHHEVRHWVIIDAILCIEMAKTLPFFTKLNLEDQQALLKTTALLGAALTEAFYSFMASSDILIFPDGFAPSMEAMKLKTHRKVFEGVIDPIKRIKMTKEEYILLKIIIFCSSKSETISAEGRVILEAEFHRYSSLLLNHLQAKYGDAPGAVRYSQILSVMEAMTYFTQKAKEFYIFVSTIEKPPPHPTLALLDQITF